MIGCPSRPFSLPANSLTRWSASRMATRSAREPPTPRCSPIAAWMRMAGAVHLVAPGELGVARFAGRLHVGVEVAVWPLHLLEQADGGRREVAERLPGAAAEFPADGLQGLVDVGVHEDGAVVAARPGLRAVRPPGRGERGDPRAAGGPAGSPGPSGAGASWSAGASAAMASRRLSRFPAAVSWRTASGRLAVTFRCCHSGRRPPVTRAGGASGRWAEIADAVGITGPPKATRLLVRNRFSRT